MHPLLPLAVCVGCWLAVRSQRDQAALENVRQQFKADVAKTLLQPAAQRNPLGLMLGAFALGGVLAWSRPWRHILTPALLVGLLPQVLSRVAANKSAQSWMTLRSILTPSQRRPDPVAASVTPPDQPICRPMKAGTSA